MSIKELNPGTGQNHVGTKNKIICFDVDGTLYNYNDKPRTQIIDTLKLFVSAGWTVCVWSGGGRDYAAGQGRRLGLPETVLYTSKSTGVVIDGVKVKPHIAVDDQYVNLGERNVYVGLKGDAY